MRALVSVQVWIFVACGSIDLPGEGTIACSPADDCPRGMRCADDGFCYQAPPTGDAAIDGDGSGGADADGPALLLLSVDFEGSTASSTGLEALVAQQLSYVDGHTGDGIDMRSPSRLEYPTAALTADEGTIELWIAPSWAPADGLNHHFVTWGYDHGLLLFRDTNEYLRFLVNRFGTTGMPPEERGVAYDVSSLPTDTWYHLAATWTAGAFKLYLDGNPVDSTTDVTLLAAPDELVAIGSEAGGSHADAILDDLRTWSVALTADQIAGRAARGRR